MSNFPPITAATTGSITTVNSLVANSFVYLSVLGPGPATLQFAVDGTFSGAVFAAFTLSPGGALVPIVPTNIVSQATLAKGAPTAPGIYTCPCAGGAIYIVATSFATGSASVTPISGLPGGSLDGGDGGSVSIVDGGSSGVNTAAGDKTGLVTNVNSQTLSLSLTGTGTANTTPLTINVASGIFNPGGNNPAGQGFIDVSEFVGGGFTVAVLGTSVTSLVMEGSNDAGAVLWSGPLVGSQANSTNGFVGLGLASGTTWSLPSEYRFIRFLPGQNQTALVSTVEVFLRAAPNWSPRVQLVTSVNTIGFVSPQAAATGGYSFAHIAGATAGTSVKSGAGTLHAVTINTKGTVAVATVYDGTSTAGAVLAVIDLTLGDNTLLYDAAVATGIFLVVTGTLSDITVSFK